MNIEIKILNKGFYRTKDVCGFSGVSYNLPKYATEGSAGIDLVCTEDVIVPPGVVRTVFTGLAIYIDCIKSMCDYAGLILPRSGLGTRGLVIANTVGLIDQDYQGEIILQVLNRNAIGSDNIVLLAGDRIAQLVIIPIERAKWKVVEQFSETTGRRIGGWGSTGN